jgi:hypothetical protein
VCQLRKRGHVTDLGAKLLQGQSDAELVLVLYHLLHAVLTKWKQLSIDNEMEDNPLAETTEAPPSGPHYSSPGMAVQPIVIPNLFQAKMIRCKTICPRMTQQLI